MRCIARRLYRHIVKAKASRQLPCVNHGVEVSNHLGADIGKQVHQFSPNTGRVRFSTYVPKVNGRRLVLAQDTFIFKQCIAVCHT